jgi:inosine-uridine nucleoside N-ribohydrolase
MKNEKLILVPIGKLTNISLALHKRPDIAKKIKVIWLGSNWPKPGEYNLKNDPSSVNTILENPEVEFEIVTVRYGEKSGTDAVNISVDEIKNKMKNLGPKIEKSVVGRHGGKFNNFGDYSIELFVKYGYDRRPLFDLCALSILKNPNWAEKKSINKVSFNGLNWSLNGQKDREITFWENFKRKEILDDFFETMQNSENLSNK